MARLWLVVRFALGVALAALSASSAQGQIPSLYEVHEVTASQLRMRLEPSLESEVVAILKRGTPVLIVKRRGDWVRVHVNAQPSFGWVMRDYLKGPDK